MPIPGKPSLTQLKSELNDLSTRIHTMEKLTRDIGGPRDGEGLRRKLRSEREKAKASVRSLAQQLQKTSPTTGSDRALHRKLQTNFKELLRRFETVAEESLQRERKATLINDDNPGQQHTPENMQTLGLEEVKLRTWQAATLETEEAQAREKHRELLDLETDLHELHSCYVEFSTLVDEQEDLIDNLGDNVQRSVKNVEKGVTEIKTASKYQKKSRKLMCILILILVGVIAAVAIAVSLGVTLFRL